MTYRHMVEHNKPISRVPGHNVDPVDIAAGMRTLEDCGYDDTVPNIAFTREIILYSLQLWARGEEALAQKKAIDQSFYGIDLTSWTRVISSAITSGKAQLDNENKE